MRKHQRVAKELIDEATQVDATSPPAAASSAPERQDDLTRAAFTLADLARKRDEIERAITALVLYERTLGASWADVGQALGCSKQAAQQRYGR